ncbi:MAG: bifunctional tRNA (5-methylaminomethyl-2-thiouridine)(34)-methyltransferase MnmD/FAD-dependent 5-carboxymethylaminomethyl-2-thiouridine(34) oxidoreductase MnmC [Rhodobacteraceae bacterium]|nr:bifunctional tRNA (5-methylaminomethyl-2-thiouridine)(34)-methyltransferase MnmD/FAD-dependent 5-carboxymethylaminomethyl-2-thiouridine(34) oxidoreductase MnmC [Paracoccaceae bacterium]
MNTAAHLTDPGLSWLPHRVAHSSRFDDTYFSRDGGLAEKRHVFLGGCGLPNGWGTAPHYTICELGFGTGLNFLSTWDSWRRSKPFGARLHYLAVEGFPLSHDDIIESVAAWPELRQVGPALVRGYPHPQPGLHRIFLDKGQVTLTLMFGDAAAMLTEAEAQVDAWFLDGFAPDRNPDMWSAAVMTQIARLSKPNARLATYSVAGVVREGLSAVGFDVQRTEGFGQKREMLRATFHPQDSVQTHHAPAAAPLLAPWFAHPPAARLRHGRAAVIGAGIAGANAAYALKRRGWQVTIVDRAADIADGASGNAVGVLMPRLTAAPNFDGRFYAAAWRFALDQLEDLADAGQPLMRDRCGVLFLATDDAERERQGAIAENNVLPEPLLFRVSAKEASDLSGVTLPYDALYFPQGGWISPRHVCKALLADSDVVLSANVAGLRRGAGTWDVLGNGGETIVNADIVVFAVAGGTAAFSETRWLPVQARRGQITFVKPGERSRRLHSVLVYGGYMTPAHRGSHCLGATFDWIDDPAAAQSVEDADHDRNLADLASHLPDLDLGDVVDGRAALRCVLPDHLPAAGALPDDGAYLRDFAELRHGHPWARYPQASYQPGLYVLSGLGSRGLVSAPLAAEILACHIAGDPWPVERDIVNALHPGRFLVRDLKRLKV